MYYYQLTEDGRVFNARTERFLKPCCGCYKLRTTSGRTKSISRNKLTMMLYGYTVLDDTLERLDGEEFRVIPGTDEKYAVSNCGRVISYIG